MKMAAAIFILAQGLQRFPKIVLNERPFGRFELAARRLERLPVGIDGFD
jgi:hypothetical protein